MTTSKTGWKTIYRNNCMKSRFWYLPLVSARFILAPLDSEKNMERRRGKRIYKELNTIDIYIKNRFICMCIYIYIMTNSELGKDDLSKVEIGEIKCSKFVSLPLPRLFLPLYLCLTDMHSLSPSHSLFLPSFIPTFSNFSLPSFNLFLSI